MPDPAELSLTMNDLLPRPWDAIAYAIVLLISLGMLLAVVFFISSHCEWVYQETGIQGACGIGNGWILFELPFLVIAVYSGWQLYGIWKEQKGDI